MTSRKNLFKNLNKIKKTPTLDTVIIPRQEYDELRKLVAKGKLIILHYGNLVDEEYQEMSEGEKHKTWQKFVDELNILHDIADFCEELHEELIAED